MTVSDSIGEGRFFEKNTSSTTVEIPVGRILEYDSSDDLVLPTTTINVDQLAGVSASKVAARTTATKKKIVVQVYGLTHICCAANAGFGVGKLVRATEAGRAAAAALATTITGTALAACIGRVVEKDATTTGTTILVALNLG